MNAQIDLFRSGITVKKLKTIVKCVLQINNEIFTRTDILHFSVPELYLTVLRTYYRSLPRAFHSCSGLDWHILKKTFE